MPKYRLIGGSRRSLASLEERIKAIADIYGKHRAAKDVLRPFYERAGRDLPTNLSVVLTGWRAAIQARLDADDAAVIALCKQHGVIEEGEPEPKRRRRARK